MAYVSTNPDDDEEKKKNSAALSGEVDPSAVGQGGGGAVQAAPYTQTGFASAKNIFEKNKGAADQYDVTQPFQEDVKDASANLSGKFAKLQSSLGSQVKSKQVNDNDLSQAIAKGQSADSWQQVMGALKPGAVSGSMEPVQTKYNANDVTSLNTAPGIQSAIANQAEKKGVQNYTQGMGALDSAIYQSNPQYRQKVTDLAAKYGDYDKQKQDYAKQTTAAVEKSNKELQDYSESLKGQLNSRAQAVRDNADIYKNKDAMARVMERENALRSDAARQQEALFQSVGSGIGDEEARNRFMADSTHTGGLNLGDYFKVNSGNNYDYSGEDAAQFNNIMSLLGQGDRVGTGNGVESKFDRNRLENDLGSRAGRIQQELKAERDAKERAKQQAQPKQADQGSPETPEDKAKRYTTNPVGEMNKDIYNTAKKDIPKVIDTDTDHWW